MGVVEELFQHLDPEIKQQLPKLKKLAKRSKVHLIRSLKKNAQACREKILLNNEEDKDGCTFKRNRGVKFLGNKLNKISEEIEIINGIPEEAVAKYVLTFEKDCKALMTVAANVKNSKILRCTARIACHQPLFNHVKRMKTVKPVVSVPVSKPLDRLSLSYEIVKMRRFIKQAKVCTMHKLTRQLSIFRKKTNDEKVKSTEEKLVKKMFSLKELDADDVTKFLFTNSLSLESLISNEKATVKVQVMSMIGKHKVVACQLADFKSRYPDWSKTVHTLLEKKKKKRLLNLKKGGTEVELGQASGKVSEINASENIEGNESNVKIEKEEDTVDGEVSSSSSLSNDTENEVIVKKGNSSHKTLNNKGSTKETSSEEESEREEIEDEGSEDEVTESDSEEDTKKETTNSNDKITSVPVQMSLHHENDKSGDISSRGQCTTKVNDKLSKRVLNNKSINSKDKSNGIENSLQISQSLKNQSKHISIAKPKVVDSFFMTKDNKEYLSSQPPTLSEDKQNYSSGIGKQFDQISSLNKFDSFGRKEKPSYVGNKRKWSEKEDNWREKKFAQNKLEKPALGTFTKPGPKDTLIIGNRKERRRAMHDTNNYDKVEKLHPSWEAKKKQSSIAQFKGKKIVFD